MASPALVSTKTPTAGFFQVPSSFAENQASMIPAERALALILFRRATDSRGITHFEGTATLSDRTWEAWTGMKPRMKELAIKGLRERGLGVEGRGDTAKFRFDVNRWNESLKTLERSNYDPKRTERDQAAAAKKVHPDCATGCAKLRELQAKEGGSNQPSALLVMPIAQPVAQSKKPVQSDPEVKWVKTLAAMRSQFASAGVELLLKLLAILWAITGLEKVSDYVLAEAIHRAYIESRGSWNSPVPLLSAVPNVLKGWKAHGQPMDDTGEDGEWNDSLLRQTPVLKPDEKPKKKRAVDLI
jgi:hypothetical protein